MRPVGAVFRIQNGEIKNREKRRATGCEGLKTAISPLLTDISSFGGFLRHVTPTTGSAVLAIEGQSLVMIELSAPAGPRPLLRQPIPDTQSGYRIHSRRFVEDVLATIPGGRYETEMAILVKAAREGYRLVSEPIRTIYEEGNRSSHFNRLRDSYRIYRTFLLSAFRPARTGKH